MMKYRQFGAKEFKVSALGMGCMRLPTRRFMPLSVDVNKAVRLIRHAVDMGINYFDTGWFYHFGQSEKVLGMALKDGYREKIHLVDKLPMIHIKQTEDFDRYLESQLERLQTRYLDTYLFHGINESQFEKIVELGLLKKMEEAREKGLIKNIGFSFHDILPVFKKIVDHYPWDVVQIQYNYLDTTLQATTEGLEYAYKKGMAVVIMEPLKGGQLAKPPKEVLDILLKAESRKTPVEWALKYLWNKKEVAVVLSGMSTEKMLEENCEYASSGGIGTLTGNENRLLERIVDVYKKKILVPCTACNYCMPCPAGVNIPTNFAILNSANSQSNNLTDRFWKWLIFRKYGKLAKKKERVNRETPNGNGALCTKCGKCVPQCPQGINIPLELQKTHNVLGLKKPVEEVFGS